MTYLNAALAFALTFLLVSTLVSWIVISLFSIAKLRSSQMKKLLVDYFNSEVGPVIKRELLKRKSEIDSGIASKINDLAINTNLGDLVDEKELKKTTSLTTSEILEKLKNSELGLSLYEQVGEASNSIFEELGKRYEAVGLRFTESYRRRSRIWATIIALILALAVNIDTIFLAQNYLNNESMRGYVIGQSEAIISGYEDMIEAQESQTDSVSVEEVQETVSKTLEDIKEFEAMQYPVGHSYFPYGTDNERIEVDDTRSGETVEYILWAIGILLTGILGGYMGAPFWYDAVAGITKFVRKPAK